MVGPAARHRAGLLPIGDFAYGMREFAIRDPNGFLLQFGQAIEAASQSTAQPGSTTS